MNIPSLSTAISTSNISTAVNMSMLKKSMDMAKEQGEELAQMISDSTIDIKV